VLKALQESAVRGENVQETEAWAGGRRGLVLLEQSVGDNVVVDVDRAFVEVGGVGVALAVDGGAGEACVAGSVGGLYHHHGVRGRRRSATGYSDGRVPSGDGAVNGGEKKIRGRACGQEEIRGAAIGDGARGSPRGEGLAGGDDNVAPELVERFRRENIQVLCV
jgi:hypothetical protein